ncbi:MAG: 4Fe-4S ferredoxin [Desulfobacteraceae bacterium]|nr:MAG: 4Fe-4S ferredoxin [Desulfobacteraceae bacterium]
MSDVLFRKLQKQLDQYSLGFPATESGIEIKILKKLFSVDEAELFLQLSPRLETPDEIALRLGMDSQEAANKLREMAGKGLLFSLNRKDVIRYGAIPFVHGLFEFQVTRIDTELADLVRQYMNDSFRNAMASSASHFLRVIPVHQSVPVQHKIAPYEDAIELLRKAKPIVVTECMCRKTSKMLDKGCDKSREVCFMFGSMAQYYLDHDMGREVDLAEASRILAKAHDEGLVTQPATSRNPSGMCNCCGDCCGPLSSLRSYPKPAEMVFSNHFVKIDDGLCTGCRTCMDRCQMDAIQMNSSDLAIVNLDRCIGCGLCVGTCPTEAITLMQKSSGQYQVPPETTMEQMLNMARSRGVI